MSPVRIACARAILIAGLSLLCTAGHAETWIQVGGSSNYPGFESCVDTDSIRAADDGRTEFRFAFCGLREGASAVRVDCHQDLAVKFILDQQLKDGLFHTAPTDPRAPIAQGAQWVCRRR